jgi:hypothetical protein
MDGAMLYISDMSKMVDELIKPFKIYIQADNLESCQSYLLHLRTEYEDLPWDYIFQKVYLHACLKKKTAIVDWLMIIYNELNAIEQIALRNVFPYGRYLLGK